MTNKQNKIQTILVLIIVMVLVLACSFGGNSEDETEALKKQVNALQTQNAILQDSQTSTESDAMQGGEIQAPPPPPSDAAPELAITEHVEESLPEGPVSAGVPIIYDGWSMTVSKELTIIRNDGEWGIDIYIRNLGDSRRVFRFMNASVTAKDDIGNVYEMGNDSYEDCEAIHHEVKNLEVDAGESVKILSEHSSWCEEADHINTFDGVIPLEASQLIIHFENFGPYSGVDVLIDL
ncbi:MAG: hypothetical protein GYA48_03265 [Chloroflexi bacterium]|nr:hypothetical protein [Chloroflexota bacterium]